jgi:hypothetical protein
MRRARPPFVVRGKAQIVRRIGHRLQDGAGVGGSVRRTGLGEHGADRQGRDESYQAETSKNHGEDRM